MKTLPEGHLISYESAEYFFKLSRKEAEYQVNSMVCTGELVFHHVEHGATWWASTGFAACQIRKCGFCGVVFEGHKNKVFCSVKCSKSIRRSGKCKMCGVEFEYVQQASAAYRKRCDACKGKKK